ncbi:MAG: Maf family protein [Bacillota bacterium]
MKLSTVSNQPTTKLILASASPRRAAILKQIGLRFEIRASDLDEAEFQKTTSTPAETVMGLALEKARQIAENSGSGLIIGADTVVAVAGEILGKPATPAEAVTMLSKLNGKEHSVFTGVALVEIPGGRSKVSFAETKVRFRSLSLNEIEAYVATGEPLDKAGAYGIQGKGAALVEEIHGCYFNVVGLPVGVFLDLLREFGISVW